MPIIVTDTAYFTVAEARAQESALANTSKYSDVEIDAVREAVEEVFEHETNVAFVPRTVDVRLDGRGDTDLVLPNTRPIEVTAAAISTIALSSADLAALVLYSDGRVYRQPGWPRGRGNVTMTYSHGFTLPPGRVKRAAILLTKRYLVETPVSDRATLLTNPDGTSQYLVTAGVRGMATDIPEVNAVIEAYSERALLG